jgi:prephenate dehydratase
VINLTRIESRPFRSDPGNYVFFTDFEGSDKDKKIMDVLKAIQAKTKSYKFCGCYPSHKDPVA